MKEYMQPEVELVKFTSESVTGFMEGEQGTESYGFTDDDIEW